MSLFRSKPKGPTIAELLTGCTPGRLQSVGNMQVIPLSSDIDDGRFVGPDQALVSTTAYGVLAFVNRSERTLLVPSQVAYVVERGVQDHALPAGAFVKGKEEIDNKITKKMEAGSTPATPATPATGD